MDLCVFNGQKFGWKINWTQWQCNACPPPLYILLLKNSWWNMKYNIHAPTLIKTSKKIFIFFCMVAYYRYMKVLQQFSSLIFMILRFDTKWLDQGVLKALMLIKFLWKLINYRCIPYFLPQFYPILRSKIYNWSARLSRKMLF